MKCIVTVLRTQTTRIEVEVADLEAAYKEAAWLDATEAIHGTKAYDDLWETQDHEIVDVKETT